MIKRTLLLAVAALAATVALAADVTVRDPNDQGIILRYKDMGDGTWALASSPQGNVAAGGTDAGNPVKMGGVYNATPPTYTTGQRGDLQIGTRGSLSIQLLGPDLSTPNAFGQAADAGGAVNAYYSNARLQVFNGASYDRVTKATTTGRLVSAAATTNATSVKASAGTIHCLEAYNASATVKYLKIYNKASAPTVGTDTPVRTVALKATDRTSLCFPNGYYLSAGIAYALTGAAADADTTALTLADVVGLNIDYN